MKKILFLGFFLAQLYAYPQTAEEDAIIDSVLDELFQGANPTSLMKVLKFPKI